MIAASVLISRLNIPRGTIVCRRTTLNFLMVATLTAVTGASFAAPVTMRPGYELASPPCGDDNTWPPYAAVDAAPNVQVWKDTALPRAAIASACLNASSVHSGTLVAVAATIRVPEGRAALISRFGDIDSLLLIRYWSTTEQAWRPLFQAATALTQLTNGRPRGEFSSAELESGRDLYFLQQDGRAASTVTYRMRLRRLGADGFVVETENTTAVHRFALTLFEPGDLHSLYFLEQQSPDTWSYYGLTSIAGSGWLTAGHEKSYINRVVALYRHFAGIPTDLEPPPAR